MKRTDELEAYSADDKSSKDTGAGGKSRRRHRRKDRDKPIVPGQPVVRYRPVRVKKILIPEEKRKIDHDIIHAIAESIQTVGVIHPIAVRRMEIRGKSRTVLVAGAHRLEAARTLGLERIECKYIDDNDDLFVRQVQIAEDLFRKRVPALSRAELITEWCELQSKGGISGQLDQKRGRGRPRGGDSELARNLPIGGSMEARRQKIKRSKKIARITPEGKQEAIDAGFIDNEKALLAIAGVSGVIAQVNKAQTLVHIAEEFANEAGSENIVVDDDPENKTESEEPGNEYVHEGESDPLEVTYRDMLGLWNRDGRRFWTYFALADRERFIAMLRRAPCKARKDIVRLVTEAFMGRGRVYADDLDALAAKRGLSRKAVRAAVKAQGHRENTDRHDRKYYRNCNKNWKNELLKISNSELTGKTVEHDDVKETTEK